MRPHFEDLLLKTIASNKLPDDIWAALELDSESDFIKFDRLREWLHKFNALSMTFHSDFMRISFLNSHESTSSRRLSTRAKLGRLWHDSSRKSPRKWPRFVLALYLLSVIYLSVYTHFQYTYDADITRLERLDSVVRDNQHEHPGNNLAQRARELSRALERQANETRATLKLLGASHLEWPFIVQSVFMIFLLGVSWSIVFPACHHVRGWLLLPAKAILDRTNESRARLRMTLDELRHFELNSVALASSKFDRLCRDIKEAFETSPTRTRLDVMIAHRTLDLRAEQAEQRHRSAMDQLESVALEGRLNPFAGTPRARDKLALVYALSTVGFMVYATGVFSLCYRSIGAHFDGRGKRVEWQSFNDVCNSIAILVFVAVPTVCADFLGALLNCAIFDQLETSRHLRALILSVIRANEIRFRHLFRTLELDRRASHPRGWSSGARRSLATRLDAQIGELVERDLMTVVVQYNLASKSATSARSPIQLIASNIICFAIYLPVVLMVHGAYFSRPVKLRVLLLSSPCVLFCLCSLAPLGLVQRHRIGTFSTLWTLLAQLNFFATLPHTERHLKLSASVSLAMLRSLVNDSHRTLDRSAVRFLSMPITYTNLMRLSTYIVIVQLAGSVLTTQLFGDGLARIMSDPFGLFKSIRL